MMKMVHHVPRRSTWFFIVGIVTALLAFTNVAEADHPNGNNILESPNNTGSVFVSNLSSNDIDAKEIVRKSRSLPQRKYFLGKPSGASGDDVIIQDMKESKDKGTYVIPYLRPGRSGKDTMVPMPRFGRNGLDSELIPNPRFGRSGHDTMIPTIRFGRSGHETMIPTVRFGRGFGESNAYTESGGNVIPYPRPGRSQELGEEDSGSEASEEHKIRKRYADENPKSNIALTYDVRLQDSTDKSDNKGFQRTTRQSMIPQVRFGRSQDDFNLMDTLLPYPRPGRDRYTRPVRSGNNLELQSDIFLESEHEKRQGHMIPYARLGRSEAESSDFEDLLVGDGKYEDISYLIPLLNSKSPKSKEIKEKLLKLGENTSVFLIPYPRPGKRSIGRDTMIPSIRFGRSMVPYPRLGRFSESDEITDSKRSESGLLPYPRLGRAGKFPNSKEKDSATTGDFILPYPRPGRNSNMVPYPRLGRSGDSKNHQFIVPYPRLGRSESEKEFILPYPRPGRSETPAKCHLLPYPRLGRSELGDSFEDSDDSSRAKRAKGTVIPYPRPGRSELKDKSYARFSRSETNINENNTPERVDSNLVSNSNTVIPYPRLGRAE